MLNPKTIIEIDYEFSEKELLELKRFLSESFYIKENELEFFNAKDYTYESEFSDRIYSSISKSMSSEYEAEYYMELD